MARVAVDIKRRRKNAHGLFTTENVNLKQREWNRLSGGARGRARFVFSWMSLMLGLFSCYTAMHYAPSLFNTNQTLAIRTPGSASASLDVDRDHILSPYIELFKLKRTYMRSGQTITAQYSLPAGGTADLRITKCRTAIVLEVFNCDPVGTRVVSVSDRSGAREFVIGESGFYHFREVVTTRSEDDDFRVVWRRS